MKKTITVLGIELLVIFFIAFAVLFIFKIFPFNASSSFLNTTNLPIDTQAKGVESTKVIYVLKSTVKSIKPTEGNLYTVRLADFPTQNFVFDKDMNTFLVEKNTTKKMSEVAPDDVISVAAIYDPVKRLWVASQHLPAKNTVTGTPIPNTK